MPRLHQFRGHWQALRLASGEHDPRPTNTLYVFHVMFPPLPPYPTTTFFQTKPNPRSNMLQITPKRPNAPHQQNDRNEPTCFPVGQSKTRADPSASPYPSIYRSQSDQ